MIWKTDDLEKLRYNLILNKHFDVKINTRKMTILATLSRVNQRDLYTYYSSASGEEKAVFRSRQENYQILIDYATQLGTLDEKYPFGLDSHRVTYNFRCQTNLFFYEGEISCPGIDERYKKTKPTCSEYEWGGLLLGSIPKKRIDPIIYEDSLGEGRLYRLKKRNLSKGRHLFTATIEFPISPMTFESNFLNKDLLEIEDEEETPSVPLTARVDYVEL